MNFNTHKTIVFFGDSVTEGCFGLYPTSYGFDTYKSPEKAYAFKTEAILKAIYRKDKVTCINAGISGNNAHMGLLRVEKDVVSHSPDLVVTAFGLNDIFRPAEQYENYLTGIVEKIKACGARVIILTPNMMNTYVHPETIPAALTVAEKTSRAQNDGTMDLIVNKSRAVADKFNAPVCDVYLYWKYMYDNGADVTSLLSNYINHPNEDMHGVTAELLIKTINEIE